MSRDNRKAGSLRAGQEHWAWRMPEAVLDTAAVQALAPPEDGGSGLPAVVWDSQSKQLVEAITQDTSHKPRLQVDEEEGKVGTQQGKKGAPEISQAPAQGCGDWRKPLPTSKQA